MASAPANFQPLHSIPSGGCWAHLVTICQYKVALFHHCMLLYVSEFTAPLIPLPSICSATQVKLQEGLQHNTCRVYQCEQWVFQNFCNWYNLQAFPASEDTLMVYITYLDDHLQHCYATIHHHLAAIHSAHITLGLPNPLLNCPRLQQLLWATQRHQPLPQPDSGHQGITTKFLCRAKLLHCPQSPKDRGLWAALTMGHYGLFCSSELVQPKMAEASVPCFIRVQDITLQFTQGWLHYICVFLTSSKTDQFHQGCSVVIGCTGTSICGVCKAWHLLQHHQWMGSSLKAPFFQLHNRALDHMILVNHIKHIATRLRLDPSRYSGHSLHIGGATSAAKAGLSQWQIKLLGCWNSQVYQVYIRQDPLVCAELAAHRAANS